jgi:hypothetical protein
MTIAPGGRRVRCPSFPCARGRDGGALRLESPQAPSAVYCFAAGRMVRDGVRPSRKPWMEPRAIQSLLHGQHDLAGDAVGLAEGVGLGGLGEWEDGFDVGAQGAGLCEGCDGLHSGVVGLDE